MEDAPASREEALETREEMETLETNEETVEKTEPQKPEKVEKSIDVQSVLAQKDHFRTKLEKSEEKVKGLEEKLKGFTSQITGDPMEAVRLGKALKDTSEEEADVIITYAKGKFNTLKPTPEQIIQASKDEWVTTAITAKREKVAGENKTPAPSSPSTTFGGKTPEDVEKMDSKTFAKYARENLKEKGTGI